MCTAGDERDKKKSIFLSLLLIKSTGETIHRSLSWVVYNIVYFPLPTVAKKSLSKMMMMMMS